jgi:hypothetical protein
LVATRTQIRQELLVRIPELGEAVAAADSVGTTYIADLSEFGDSNLGTDELRDLFIHRYNLTGNDRVHATTTVDTTTGRLSVVGPVYSNTSDTAYELLGLHPDDLNNAILTAQRQMWLTTHVLLTVAHDHDMELGGVQYWDGTLGGSSTSSAAVTKVATAPYVYSGTQALFVNLSGANGYTRGETVRVTPGKRIFTAIIARADVGTVTLKLRDVSNGAYIATTNDKAYSGESFAVLQRYDTVPDGCEEVQVEIRGTGATDDLYVDCVYGPLEEKRRRMALPSWMDESFKVYQLRPSSFRSLIVDGIYDAGSREFTGDWMAPVDYNLETLHREVNPNNVIFTHDLPAQQLVWIAAQRSYYDVEPLLTESSATTAPFEELMAYVMREVTALLVERQPEEARWRQLNADARTRTAKETLARPAPPREPYRLDQRMVI